jgi:uncharacterized protein DUF1841
VFNPSRSEARSFFVDAWEKHGRGEILTPLEAMAVDVVLGHPEYQSQLEQCDRYLERDYPPEYGVTNPFLHLSLHLAVAEQLSVDQPPGICEAHRRLLRRSGSEHEAAHRIMECLAETMWRSQGAGTPPDGAFYLDCLEKINT